MQVSSPHPLRHLSPRTVGLIAAVVTVLIWTAFNLRQQFAIIFGMRIIPTPYTKAKFTHKSAKQLEFFRRWAFVNSVKRGMLIFQ